MKKNTRRNFLTHSAALGLPLVFPFTQDRSLKPFLKVEEITIDQLRILLDTRKTTSVALVREYMKRIQQIDQSGPKLASVLEINPDALDIARKLDEERGIDGARGPLHGIPILIKDNIDTADKMKTTAGSWALADAPTPAEDAAVVQSLRKAGAIILGKTNLSEWANFRSTRSSSGWSGRGRQTKNPYALDRNPSGSSSGTGSAISANLAVVGVGTETDGSIVSPSNVNGLVGFKPTVGLVSRRGIIPISASQDTAGPMTRTVKDAALLLSAMASLDPQDPKTLEGRDRRLADYAQGIEQTSLRGVRLGVLKTYISRHPEVEKVALRTLDLLKNAGAILVDVELNPSTIGDAETQVLQYEFKEGLRSYLGNRGGSIKNLADIIAYNDSNSKKEMPFFGQEIMIASQAKGDLNEEIYLKALKKCQIFSRQEGIDAYLAKYQVEVLVSPTSGPAWLTDHINVGGGGGFSCSSLPAMAGYPHLTIPMGMVYGLPVGWSIIGTAWQDQRVLHLGFAMEQIFQARRAPRFLPTAQAPD